MARTVTSKAINLAQLDKELGGQGLSMNDNDPTAIVVVTSDESTITQTELEAGVAGHVAVPYVNPDDAIKASIGAKLASPTYVPLDAIEVTFLAKAIS